MYSNGIPIAFSVLKVNKDRYLKDLKPFMYVLSSSNIILQLSKSALLPANALMMEYNLHVTAQESDPQLPEFDWDKAVPKHWVSFKAGIVRNFSVSLLKKVMEEIALLNLPPSFVDKLTKEVWKSLKRKSEKFGHAVACRKIFYTQINSNIIFNTASFLFDLIYGGISYIYEQYTKPSTEETRGKIVVVKKQYVDVIGALLFTANKLTYYSLISLASAAGYSGGAWCNEKYGGFVGAAIGEIMFAAAFTTLTN